MRIYIKIIFHLSKLWQSKFSLLCDVIFLVGQEGKFDIDHSQEWKGFKKAKWFCYIIWIINQEIRASSHEGASWIDYKAFPVHIAVAYFTIFDCSLPLMLQVIFHSSCPWYFLPQLTHKSLKIPPPGANTFETGCCKSAFPHFLPSWTSRLLPSCFLNVAALLKRYLQVCIDPALLLGKYTAIFWSKYCFGQWGVDQRWWNTFHSGFVWYIWLLTFHKVSFKPRLREKSSKLTIGAPFLHPSLKAMGRFHGWKLICRGVWDRTMNCFCNAPLILRWVQNLVPW